LTAAIFPGKNIFPTQKNVFKAYIDDREFRDIIDQGNFAYLNVSPHGESFQKLPPELQRAIPEYIKDYVPLNSFIV
jgi:type I restriction enzyme R subunit